VYFESFAVNEEGVENYRDEVMVTIAELPIFPAASEAFA